MNAEEAQTGWEPLTHQHLLELLYRLIGNADAVNLTDLISYMQGSWWRQRKVQ